MDAAPPEPQPELPSNSVLQNPQSSVRYHFRDHYVADPVSQLRTGNQPVVDPTPFDASGQSIQATIEDVVLDSPAIGPNEALQPLEDSAANAPLESTSAGIPAQPVSTSNKTIHNQPTSELPAETSRDDDLPAEANPTPNPTKVAEELSEIHASIGGASYTEIADARASETQPEGPTLAPKPQAMSTIASTRESTEESQTDDSKSTASSPTSVISTVAESESNQVTREESESTDMADAAKQSAIAEVAELNSVLHDGSTRPAGFRDENSRLIRQSATPAQPVATRLKPLSPINSEPVGSALAEQVIVESTTKQPYYQPPRTMLRLKAVTPVGKPVQRESSASVVHRDLIIVEGRHLLDSTRKPGAATAEHSPASLPKGQVRAAIRRLTPGRSEGTQR